MVFLDFYFYFNYYLILAATQQRHTLSDTQVGLSREKCFEYRIITTSFLEMKSSAGRTQ